MQLANKKFLLDLFPSVKRKMQNNKSRRDTIDIEMRLWN